MTELLDLGCERAGAAAAQVRIDHARKPTRRSHQEPRPVYGGIPIPVACVEQMLVLDEEQCAYDQRRNFLEGAVDSRRIAGGMQYLAVAVVERETGLVLFLIRWVARPHEASQGG